MLIICCRFLQAFIRVRCLKEDRCFLNWPFALTESPLHIIPQIFIALTGLSKYQICANEKKAQIGIIHVRRIFRKTNISYYLILTHLCKILVRTKEIIPQFFIALIQINQTLFPRTSPALPPHLSVFGRHSALVEIRLNCFC